MRKKTRFTQQHSGLYSQQCLTSLISKVKKNQIRLPNDLMRKDLHKRVFSLEKLLHITYLDKVFPIVDA